MKKIFLILFMILNIYANDCYNKFFTYSNSINSQERMKIKDFLDLLVTQKCGINIVYDDDESKKIVDNKMPFVKIKHFTLREILDLLLAKRNLFYSLSSNTLEISYFKTKTYKLDFLTSSRTGESNLDATDSKVKNTYDFDFWDKIEDNIKTILQNTSKDYKPPVIDKAAGLITVTGTKKQVQEIDEYINNLIKRLTKEVLIDVKIYTVELSESHKTGIDWSKLNLALDSQSIPVNNFAHKVFGRESVFNSATFNLQGFLNFLAENGNVNSLSNPKIVTLNNQKAIISVGDTIYYKYASSVVNNPNAAPSVEYTIDSKFVGVVLDITPQINDNGDIILSIAPRISSFKNQNQLKDTTRDMPPDTRDNTMLSIVKLKDNDTLVLGGLITNEDSLNVNGVPVLKEIPLVKYLFSSKEKVTNKKELVFVITPHIIDFSKKKTLRDLGFGKF
ncbi:general secretion pathway protein D [Lebetimonas natsushimae]|uniref:General secretion pathway protein D n=1 Tax=Lebetimonas natsushimae TaxID=1936991 RepID=A0A292Y8U5_9BACT|nr:type II protein secretion system D protein [Lebetimonas natsushimae]GAX87292.1 general secretion pathway protein D [Lebetimonas natsushimae]